MNIKLLTIIFSVFLFVSCGGDKDYPKSISKKQLQGEFGKKFYRYFGSYIQKEDGEFTKEMGKVFFLKTPKGLKVAFYTPSANGYQLLDKPVLVPDTDKAGATVPPGEEVPGYMLKGKSNHYIFVKNGKIIIK